MSTASLASNPTAFSSLEATGEATDNGRVLIERARNLTPLLAQHAAEAEELRRPTDTVIHALEEAEIFKLMVPKRFGGLELDLDVFFEVGVALGEGDASMAWVANFFIEHNWILAHFPESFQREIFAARSYALAPAMVAPGGKVESVPGGYRLNGRWQWASGISHGDWVIPTALEMTADGRPDVKWFALPVSDVRVEDTWFVSGMRATGSNDIVIEDVFVPEERTTCMLSMGSGHGHGATLHDHPLYRTPMMPILSLAAAMPALGQARTAVKMFRQRLGERVLMETGGRQAERPGAQMRLARAEVDVVEAELLMRETVADVCRVRNAATIADRARWAAQLAIAVERCKNIIQHVCEASGAHANFQANPLQRMLRDVNTLSCHLIFGVDNRLEGYGRTLLGLDPGRLATIL